MGTMEGDERVKERSVCCMKKKKKQTNKQTNEWLAKRVRILVRCVVEGSGVGGSHVWLLKISYTSFFFLILN